MEDAPVLLGSSTQKQATELSMARSRKLGLWFAVIVASYLPFLTWHFAALLQKPHYQYAPLLVVTIVLLVRRR